jgi:hypothetical protein
MINYEVKDIALQRKKTHGFEEYRLDMQPNSIIVSDAANNLSMVDTSSFYAAAPIQISASYAITASHIHTASFAVSANTARSASFATTASYAFNAVTASTVVSASFAASSTNAINAVSTSYSVNADNAGNSVTATSASYSVSSSNAISASYAPFVQQVQVSASWASASLSASYASTAGQAISASYVPNLYPQTVQVSSSWASASLSSSHADFATTAFQATSASYAPFSGIGGSSFPLNYTFKNTTTAGDPGSGNFRFNSTTSHSVNNVFISNTTNGGVDVATILPSLTRQGNYLYFQDTDDASNAFLFLINGETVNSSSWLAVPVTYVSSSAGVFNNNARCTSIILNLTTVTSASYAVSASHSSVAEGIVDNTLSTLTLSGNVLTFGYGHQIFGFVGSGGDHGVLVRIDDTYDFIFGQMSGLVGLHATNFYGNITSASLAQSARTASFVTSSNIVGEITNARSASFASSSILADTASLATTALQSTTASYLIGSTISGQNDLLITGFPSGSGDFPATITVKGAVVDIGGDLTLQAGASNTTAGRLTMGVQNGSYICVRGVDFDVATSYIGINTTDPQALLHVQGNISASSVSASAYRGDGSHLTNVITTLGGTTQNVQDEWGIANPSGSGIQLGAGDIVYLDGTIIASSGNFSGSLTGTASFSTSASYARSASFATSVLLAQSSSYVATASSAASSSHATFATTAGALVTTNNYTMNTLTATAGADIRGPFVDSLQIGNGAGAGTTSGNLSVQIGRSAGSTVAAGAVQIGYQAGFLSPNAAIAVQIGAYAGWSSAEAAGAVQVGYQAGEEAYTASNAVMVGYNAGFASHLADNAVLIGYTAGFNSFTSSNSVQIGKESGYFAYNAPRAIFIGNTAGYNAQFSSDAVMIGNGAGNQATTSSNVVYIGTQAGRNATITTQSVFIGTNAGRSNAAGGGSVSIGALSSYGTGASEASTADSMCVFIGYNATKDPSAGDLENAIAIGAGTRVDSSNKVVLGNENITATVLRGTVTFGSTSSAAPVDPGTVVAWLPITASGQTFYMPLYQ